MSIDSSNESTDVDLMDLMSDDIDEVDKNIYDMFEDNDDNDKEVEDSNSETSDEVETEQTKEETEITEKEVTENEETEATEKEVTSSDSTSVEEELINQDDDELQIIDEIQEETKKESKFITLFDCLENNESKIKNASKISLSGASSIPDGKYLLYATNDKNDADLFLIQNPKRLAFEKFDPSELYVLQSGVIIQDSNNKVFVSKTNVIHYKINNETSTPDSVVTYKKVSKNSSEPKTKEKSKSSDQKSLDEIKLSFIGASNPLEKEIKDIKTVDELRNKILEFMKNIIDINYLVKLYNVMLDCGL